MTAELVAHILERLRTVENRQEALEVVLGEVRRLLTAGPPLTVVEVVEPDGAAEERG